MDAPINAGSSESVRTPPADLPNDVIATALATDWGFARVTLTYLPLGFGSHHWLAEDFLGRKWFVTVDDLQLHHLADLPHAAYRALAAAFRTAVALRDEAELPFVVGPIATVTGGILSRIGTHFALAVYPYFNVEPSEFGAFRTSEDRTEAMRLIASVHNATSKVPLDNLRRDTLEIPNRTGLLDALSTLDRGWDSGPYASRAQDFLGEHRDLVLRKLEHFDHLVHSAASDPSEWVVTHGEPHAGNVIRTRSGDLVVVDWDTVALAPRERDLWMMVSDVKPDWSAYRDVTGISTLSQAALDAYRLHWNLTEISIYVGWLRKPHERTVEMDIAWSSLKKYLAM